MFQIYFSRNKFFAALILILVLFFSSRQRIQAQRKYGNEWINYSQTYYKIKVVQNGIYRLGYSDLQNAGINVSTLDPTHLQMFFRGAETAIYLSSGSKTSFNPGDYIEFYGQGNDGALDSVLYLNPADDINKSYSMYTDTAAYFLTVGNNASMKRYALSNKNYSNNPEPYYLCEKDLNLHDSYYDGVPIDPTNNFTGSDYTSGEGWMGANITCITYGNPASATYTISLGESNIPADTTKLPKPQLEVLIYGKSDVATQNPDHHLEILTYPGKSLIWDTIFDGFKTIHKIIPQNWSSIAGKSQQSFVIQAAGIMPTSGTSTSDEIAVSFLKLRYDNQFQIDATNPYLSFKYLNSSSGPETDFEFLASSTPATANNLVLYDLTNSLRTKSYKMTGKIATFGIENYKQTTSYILYDTTKALNPVSVSKVNFIKPDYNQNYNYIIVTHKKFASGAQSFASYKATQMIDSVNFFKPLIVYSDELFDQFFYGVHHPAAIQNFMAFLYNNTSQKPQYLMLLGKGIDNADVRTYSNSDYVPSIGYPPTDVMFTSEINIGFQGPEKFIDPKMGIGRLQILANTDVITYLNKLKEYDASIDNELPYLKTAINVDGGDAYQILRIRNFMDAEAGVLSKAYSGLKVNSYYSVSNTAVNADLQTIIQNNIQQGTGLFSYLAHGSPEDLQVDFADTTTLKNKGHYPIMYLNGCNIGNAFLPPYATSYGRFYTLVPDKGAIVWLSHSNEALDNVLYSQMGAFFKNVAVSNYGKSVGSTWRKTITDLNSYDADSEYRALLYEWVLQGDPSVRFPYLSKPDYAVFDSTLFIVPNNVIASAASFKIAIPVTNHGKAISSSMKLEIRQTLPDQSVIKYDSVMPTVMYLDTFYFNINRNNLNIQGINKFDVYVNYDSAVDETSFANNHASFTYYFKGNGIRALFPVDYDIVNTDTPALISQSRNVQIYKPGIYFEIDTTTRFNSPLNQISPLINGSSTVTWHPKLNNIDHSGHLIDSTVYFWRTRMNLPADTGGEWNINSFIYLKNGKPGWSQSNWGQYKNISPDFLNIDTLKRLISYPPKYLNYVLTMTAFNKNGLGIKSGTEQYFTYGTGNITLIFVEVDKNTLNPISFNRLNGNPLVIHNYNGIPTLPVVYQQFDMTDPAYRDSFTMAVNAVPVGNYILICSSPKGGSRKIPGLQDIYNFEPSVFQAFDKIGDTMMRNIKRDSVAYVIAGKKGKTKGTLLAEQFKYDNYAKWSSGTDPGDTVYIDPVLQGTLIDSGSIISDQIGPATNWHKSYQNYLHLETPTADQSYLNIIGVDKNGRDTILFQNIAADSFDISKINAQKYPNLKLQAFLNDTLNWTPPQLRLWQVEYDGIPEGSLICDSSSVFPKNLYLKGDSIHLKLKFQNLSNLPMSKVLTTFKITDISNSPKIIDSVYYPAINPGQYFWITKTYPTMTLSGNNYLTVFANPGFQQPEQTLDNNYVQFPFQVIVDKINPIMDVTFDGVHIADGQIISPDPEILINERDENKFLILNDTSDYNVKLQYPGSPQPKNIYFSNPKVQFIPGNQSRNNSEIKFQPGPLADGLYFFSVQASDASGNLAGLSPYSIHFQVVNQPAISKFYMYPNPMTDIARFGFTITGNTVPQIMEIQISDITGRIVRTIDLSGSSGLKPGANEITWDGTDNSGASLNQGMYFYKAIAKLNGNEPANYPLPIDTQLQTGFGKFLILR